MMLGDKISGILVCTFGFKLKILHKHVRNDAVLIKVFLGIFEIFHKFGIRNFI